MRRWASILVAAAVVTAIGAAAWVQAQERPRPSSERKTRILKQHPEADTDGDGTLSDEEMGTFYRERRQEGRGPGDDGREGQGRMRGRALGPAEREQLLQQHPELDTNKDGTLDESELRAAGPEVRRMLSESLRPSPAAIDWLIKNFDSADLDRDGKLSKEELQQLRSTMGPLGDRGVRSSEEILKRYPQADTDGDGKLSMEERRAFMEKEGPQLRQNYLREHPEADANGDGELSQEEFRAAMQKNRPGRRNTPPAPQAEPPAQQ